MNNYKIKKTTFWKNFYHFNEVESTNLEAKELIIKGISSGIVIADSQTKGRGRNSKKWESPNIGNIYVTFFGKMQYFMPNTISKRTVLATKKTVEDFISTKVEIKWPNDILISGKKISGILGETTTCNGEYFYIIGIGLNLFPVIDENQEFQWQPTSIIENSEKKVSTEKVFQNLVKNMNFYFSLDNEKMEREFNEEIKWMKRKKILFSTITNKKMATILDFKANSSIIVLKTDENKIIEHSSISIEKIF